MILYTIVGIMDIARFFIGSSEDNQEEIVGKNIRYTIDEIMVFLFEEIKDVRRTTRIGRWTIGAFDVRAHITRVSERLISTKAEVTKSGDDISGEFDEMSGGENFEYETKKYERSQEKLQIEFSKSGNEDMTQESSFLDIHDRTDVEKSDVVMDDVWIGGVLILRMLAMVVFERSAVVFMLTPSSLLNVLFDGKMLLYERSDKRPHRVSDEDDRLQTAIA